MNKSRKILIYIIIAILLILFSIMIIFVIKPSKKHKDSWENRYNFSKEVVELPGTKKYTNDEIKKAHCVNNICVEDVLIYYADEGGRIEYRVTNKSSKTASGYLKIVYDKHEFVVIYKDLKPNDSINSISEFKGIKIGENENYTLKKLSKEEIKKIIKK